ncbi:hypothetical protein [Acidocella aminolytica]|uniref:Uncharacterized protein n=1 Tax=Acidocella aminolytica 101 = DSM 11237 TaxID=1120923 RepID=A0A0D6PHT2_9PROT|nr:hypothetical protein [Acidocella aminolytica]GAN80394.1 hypothetical protein Aam_046_035 [Acidocella aminolytica 101 = DSM 11237]GBQ34847.1 hypothetical protein AA11237_0839 [Acidocella aminolytica 101 = DSM 11237]SHF44730.1 hypothetical protein SAMN02746095_03292 [Acidocella aminolytica 101 = DSM 11237]
MTSPRQIRSTDPADMMKPGYVVEIDHDLADELGAFVEDAISLEDAIESDIDVEEPANG